MVSGGYNAFWMLWVASSASCSSACNMQLLSQRKRQISNIQIIIKKDQKYQIFFLWKWHIQVVYQEKIILQKSGDALAQAAREVVDSPSLEMFKNHGDVALKVSGHGGDGLGLDLDSVVVSNLSDSMIQFDLYLEMEYKSTYNKEW